MSPSLRPVVLVAAGGLGREVAGTLRATGGYDVLGFVDDDPSAWGTVVGDLLVLGPLAALAHHRNAAVVVCAGRGRDRAAIGRLLAGTGIGPDRLPVVVDPSARLGPNVVLGVGTVVLAGCVLTADVTVGDGCVLMPHVTLTHDVVLHDHATVCAGAALGGGVVVGSEAYVGMGATIRQRVTVGRGSTVGMGSAVIGNVPDDETWAGVPARRVAARMEVR